ncbi:MAG: heavy metal translocating P-type ATPase [Patescibacteria group bacterium]
MEEIIKIKGMHCASCANIIEGTFKKIDGVNKAQVNYGTESVKLFWDETKVSPDKLSKAIEPLGYSLLLANQGNNHLNHGSAEGSPNDKESELTDLKIKVLSALPMAALAALVMAWDILGQSKIVPAMNQTVSELFHHLLPLLATYVLFVVGRPYLLGLYRFIRYGKANMDTLVGLGTLTAYLYSFVVTAGADILRPFINVDHQYYDVTIVVITFIALGKYLEIRSKTKTGDAIAKLLNLQAKTAWLIKDGQEIEVPVSQVKHGDLIIIKPGARLPVDGVVTEGQSFIDESMVTGEPMPVAKKIGDAVVAGTINTTGSLVFKASKVGSETLLSQIIKMVQEAQGSRAPIQALADKISGIFVPIVLVIAVVALALWLIVGTYYLGWSQALSFGLVCFVGVLVIACPCALGLATPTAIIVGVGQGAKQGILIKDAASLQKLYKVDTVVMDKTGTITEGRPTVVDIKNESSFTSDQLLSVLASLENLSEHPIAKAILDYAKANNIALADTAGFTNLPGLGVKGMVAGVEYFAGSPSLIKNLKLTWQSSRLDELIAQGKTPIILATAKEVLGFVTVADEVKASSVAAIKELSKLGLRVVMLTGDEAAAANYIGSKVGIDEVVARVLPQDKLNKIKQLQAEGRLVAMVGDGVNDAPALAQAEVGIAMATGTDVAIESADVTLLHGDISKLVKAIKLSKITMVGIKQNLFWAFIYNALGIPLAAGLFYPLFGWLLNPVWAGLAMAMSSVSVVANSLRIKTKKL